jgi:tetratricopeptide (TPR) repeat protein
MLCHKGVFLRQTTRALDERELERKIDKALELRKAGETEQPVTILSTIFEEIPANDLRRLGLVGSLLREAGELSKALYCFDKAVESNPLSPRASLGRFHSLWRSGRYDEAFDELERFLSVAESEAHSMLLEDTRQEFWRESGNKVKDPYY